MGDGRVSGWLRVQRARRGPAGLARGRGPAGSKNGTRARAGLLFISFEGGQFKQIANHKQTSVFPSQIHTGYMYVFERLCAHAHLRVFCTSIFHVYLDACTYTVYMHVTNLQY